MNDITAPAMTAAARRLPPAIPAAWPTRRALQLVLGMVWLLDGALQFQPYMFSNAFVSNIISPAAAGNPAVIAAPITWSAHLVAGHIVAANAAFAVIQLGIAAGLFFRRATRLALAASIAWSVSVWWFGEGLGGILTGASPLAGLPGAVILACLLGLVFWIAEGFGGITTGQATDPNSGPLLILLAACFWPPRQPAAAASGAQSPSSRAALSWHTARSQAGPRSSRARAWS